MNRVLVDTSVWVEHFRRPDPILGELVSFDFALTHPIVIGEIACGTPPDRAATLRMLGRLAQSNQATIAEVMGFIERERLYGLGVGLNDLILLASTRITPDTGLWTLDKRLAALADRFGVRYWPA
jgi:predicted nucleic acid-binding protein